MKKSILWLFITLCVLTLIGCRTNPNYDPKIATINTMIQDFSLDQIHGFQLDTIQYDQRDQILNEEHVLQHRDKENELKIMTIVERKTMLPFDPNQQYEISETTYYYSQNRQGVQEGEGPVTWQDNSLDDWNNFKFPIKRLDVIWLNNYQITETEGIAQFNGSLKLNYMSNVLDYSSLDVSQIDIIIRYKLATKTIQTVQIVITDEYTKTMITFVPLIEPVQVIIPSEG